MRLLKRGSQLNILHQTNLRIIKKFSNVSRTERIEFATLGTAHLPPDLFSVRFLISFNPMFTGLIEEVGSVLSIRATEPGAQLEIVAPLIAETIHIGDSMAVNGCCLTLSAHRADQLTFDLLGETLAHTNLKMLKRDSSVNLERALRADGRLGGHFVQGHVDCTSRVISFEQIGGDHRLAVELPAEFGRYVVCKGSIAIDGISLTIAEVSPMSFVVWIIPHTKCHTNLHRAEAGDVVNLEFDILAKYVERMISARTPQG